jgi:hypothetical protein
MARKVKEVVADAQDALSADSAANLLNTWRAKYLDPPAFMEALDLFHRCRFWRDAGYPSLEEYCRDHLKGATKDAIRGWRVLSTLKRDDLAPLIKSGKLRPQNVAMLAGVMKPHNFRSWITLAMALNLPQLRKAVKAYKKLSETGYTEPVVFVPVWIPHAEYMRLLHGTENERAWDAIKRCLSAPADDESE